MKHKKTGFTLVELLVVISIIAILSAIGLGIYSVAVKQSRDSKRQSDLRTIQAALEQYSSDLGYYPTTVAVGTITDGLDSLLDNSPPFAFTSNIGTPNPPPQQKTYINSLPQDPTDPTGLTRYKYVANPDSCDNDPEGNVYCTSYCLYAKLENLTTPDLKNCTAVGTYNFALTPP